MNENIQDAILAFETELESRKAGPFKIVRAAFDVDELQSWIARLKKAADAKTPDAEQVKMIAAGASALAIAVRNYHNMLKRTAEACGKTLPPGIDLAMILEDGMCTMVTQAACGLFGADFGSVIDDATKALEKGNHAPAGNQETQEGGR